MSYSDSETIEIAGDIVRETEKAWLVNDGTKDVWLPKSQCEFTPSQRTHESGVFDVPLWLAKDKGLI